MVCRWMCCTRAQRSEKNQLNWIFNHLHSLINGRHRNHMSLWKFQGRWPRWTLTGRWRETFKLKSEFVPQLDVFMYTFQHLPRKTYNVMKTFFWLAHLHPDSWSSLWASAQGPVGEFIITDTWRSPFSPGVHTLSHAAVHWEASVSPASDVCVTHEFKTLPSIFQPSHNSIQPVDRHDVIAPSYRPKVPAAISTTSLLTSLTLTDNSQKSTMYIKTFQ